MALALMLSMSRSGILGLVVALASSACFVLRRQTIGARRHVAAAYLAFVLVAVVAWTGLDRLSTRFIEADAVSVQGRVAIWRDTWALFRRFPIAGTGLNTFGTATVFYQTADRTKHFFEAHNDYLQLLAEGGLLVCIPIALATVAYVRTARHRLRHIPSDSTDYWIRIGALTGVAAVAVQELVDFSLQMPGDAVLFVVLLAVPRVNGEKIGREENGVWSAEFWIFEPEPGIRLPALRISRKGADALMTLIPGRDKPAVARALEAGHSVLAFDLRGIGEMRQGKTGGWPSMAGPPWPELLADVEGDRARRHHAACRDGE